MHSTDYLMSNTLLPHTHKQRKKKYSAEADTNHCKTADDPKPSIRHNLRACYGLYNSAEPSVAKTINKGLQITITLLMMKRVVSKSNTSIQQYL